MAKEPETRPYPVAPDRVVAITKEGNGQLTVELQDVAAPVEKVGVRRCFPWSLPGSFIALLDSDGREITVFADPADIDDEYRELLWAELRDKVFNPRITRILEHTRDLGVISLVVETDRGNVTFQVRTRDDIRVLNQRQFLLRDADDNTYEIPDINELDDTSQRHMHEYI